MKTRGLNGIALSVGRLYGDVRPDYVWLNSRSCTHITWYDSKLGLDGGVQFHLLVGHAKTSIKLRVV